MKYSYPRSLHGTSITVNPSSLDSRDRSVVCSFILFSHDRDFRDRDIKCEWQHFSCDVNSLYQFLICVGY